MKIGDSMKITIYHGSEFIIKFPEFKKGKPNNDYGYGFYCTDLEKQAKRWALVKKKNHVVNVYTYTEQNDLKVLKFNEMTEKWLDFVVACRRGKEHTYDIVEGPMADDTIWDYIEDYLRGAITREAFWVLAKFKYPTHQIVFCTEKALSTLKFERSWEV